MEWISVEDRLPDDESGYRVLVYANDIVSGWVEIVSFARGEWFLDCSVYPAIITHWQKLPDNPKA